MKIFYSVRSVILWTIGILYLFLFCLWLIAMSYLFHYKTYDAMLKRANRLLFWLLFIRVKVKNVENFDKNKTYVLMANHVSMFDIPLMLGFIPAHFKGLEASGHFKTPIYGWALKRYGNISIDRNNARTSFKSIQQGIEYLKSGISLVIMPEGTRSTEPEMGEFKKLPFIAAQKSGVGIMPIAFSGLWKINNKTSGHIFPGTMTVTFGEEITAETIKSMSVEDLMVFTKEKIQSMITEP